MSATLDRKLQQAAAALAAGDLARADHLSREVLERVPRHPRALQVAAAIRLQRDDGAGAGELLQRALACDPNNLQLLEGLGAAALKAGNYIEAESWLRRALASGKAGTAALTWLGLALSWQGRTAEAVQFFREATAKAPEDPGAHLNLGHALTRVGDWERAAVSYERVLGLNPDDAAALNGFGVALLESGKGVEAAECFRRAILLAPDNADYHANLGHARLEQQLWEKAAACYKRALALRPDDPETLNSLGSALYERGTPGDAIEPIRRAIALRPEYAEAYDNLANVWLRLGRDEEAIACFRRAISLQPDNPARFSRFGNALVAQYQWDEAVAQYQHALQLDPACADAEWGIANVQLFRQQFELAWTGFEQRLKTVEYRRKGFRSSASSVALFQRLPHWNGPGESGVRDVAVWTEQGIGDQVLYSTLIPELMEVGVKLAYEVDHRLLRTYARSFPGMRFVAMQEPPRDELLHVDRVFRVGSLPGLFRRFRQDFSRQPAKLFSALPNQVTQFRQRLDAYAPKLNVALSWRSVRKDWWVSRKSLPLADFAPLLKLAGTQFVDVQYGDTAAERHAVEAAAGVRITRFEEVDHFNDLEAVLAILEACDLVITTSNATAHFAGALGKRTWLLYRADRAPFHYWAHGGTHRCLWYPSVEIVTASHLADWPSLIEHVRQRLDRESAQLGPGHNGSAPRAGGR